MHLLIALLIGFIIGLIARALMPGPDRIGYILTTLLGIAGSVIATYLGQALNMYPPDHPAGFLASIIGAMLVLWVYHLFAKRKGIV